MSRPWTLDAARFYDSGIDLVRWRWRPFIGAGRFWVVPRTPPKTRSWLRYWRWRVQGNPVAFVCAGEPRAGFRDWPAPLTHTWILRQEFRGHAKKTGI